MAVELQSPMHKDNQMRSTTQKAPESPEPRREHWSTAPELTRNRIKSWLNEANAGRLSPASALRDTFATGYDVRRDEVPQPMTLSFASTSDPEKCTELKKKFPSTQDFAEKQAVQDWNNHASWRLRSIADEATERRATTNSHELERRVQERAAQIIAKRRNDELDAAVEQARKELGA